jgi:O-antigen/teichoic acid export membrane protein
MNGDLETGPALGSAPPEPPSASPSGVDSSAVRSVAREGGWAGIFNLFGAVIRYGNNIILTRLLGAKLYGLYALANTVVTVITIPSSLGLPTSMVHFVASYAETGKWDKLRWVLKAAFRAVFFSSILGAILVLALSPWASHALFKKDGLLLPLSGLAVALPFLALYLVCSGGLQGLKAIRGKVFIERIAHPLFFSVLLVAGGFWFRSLEYVLVCFFLAAGGVLALGLFWLARRFKAIPAPAPAAPDWKHLLSFSMPVMAMQFLNYFILWSDILVMGMFWDAKEVGIYAIASRLATAVSMPTEALGASLAPSFSGLTGKGDMAGLKRLFHTSTRWTMLLAGVLCTGLVLGGLPILHVFGKDFRAGFWALCILAGGQMFSACFGANGILITMSGHPKANMANAIFIGLGNLGLQLFLVPRFGAVGAATAAALSMVVLNVTRAVEIAFLLKLGPWDRTIRKPFAVLGVTALAGWAAFRAFGPLPAMLLGLGAFAATWLLLGPEAEDLDMIGRARAKLRRSPSKAVSR